MGDEQPMHVHSALRAAVDPGQADVYAGSADAGAAVSATVIPHARMLRRTHSMAHLSVSVSSSQHICSASCCKHLAGLQTAQCTLI